MKCDGCDKQVDEDSVDWGAGIVYCGACAWEPDLDPPICPTCGYFLERGPAVLDRDVDGSWAVWHEGCAVRRGLLELERASP